jgi:hypothetical protein
MNFTDSLLHSDGGSVTYTRSKIILGRRGQAGGRVHCTNYVRT